MVRKILALILETNVNKRKRFILFVILILAIGVGFAQRYSRRTDAEAVDALPVVIEQENQESEDKPMTMSDVLDLARQARQHMTDHLDDYTARFVKQDRDVNGVLGEQIEMLMKVQTRLRGDSEGAPLRVYMKFLAPESKKGREVIWGEDLFDRKICVHGTGILGIKKLWLRPTGFLAMQGERFPITEVGMVRLMEKVILRGGQDLSNPNIEINVVPDYEIDGTTAELLQIRCSKPRGGKDDFSLAEVAIDRQRMLILMFRSFGWPETDEEDAPLLESYTYHDIETNVGLTDEDFNPDNPNYNYPAF